MSRNASIDILKILMALSVVALHGAFLQEYSTLASYITVNGLFRLAVPIFLIINGYYFFAILSRNRQNDWLKRIIILYAIWMFFYGYYWFSLPDYTFIAFIKLGLQIIIGHHHLWYLSGMALASILLMAIINKNFTILITSITITFFAGVVIQYTSSYNLLNNTFLGSILYKDYTHRNAIFFSYPFFCIGFLINKYKLHEKITLKNTFIAALLGFTMLLFESLLNYKHLDNRTGFDNLFSLLIAAPFIFIIFLKFDIQGNSKKISLYSSGIYFIHPIILTNLDSLTKVAPTTLTIFCMAASTIATYILIKVNDRIKYLL